MVTWVRWGSGIRRTARRGGVDPFSALEVQFALSRLDREITRLLQGEDASRRFAQGHHLRAAVLAYEQLLVEACRLAEVPSLPEAGGLRRVMAEAELQARGWAW
jgi:hypothetical protein